jgi:quercetin dioxygenase-like cupin family protein
MTAPPKKPEPVLAAELLSDPPGDAPSAPRAALRARLLATTESVHRFEELTSMLASDTDLPAEAVEKLLVAIDDPASWSGCPIPGVTLLHFDGGPKTAGAITGFVRIEPGHGFPEHDHGGPEVGVVLQGSLRDTIDGRVYGRGDRMVREPGKPHALEVVSRIPAIYLTVSHVGIVLGGELIGPEDARL